MTLCVLKHGEQCDFIVRTFGMKITVFEKLILRFVLGVSEFIYKNEVTGVESDFRIA